jgi:hypothetical protein
MPQGTFNFNRLTRALGLKNIIEMPISPVIQPVIPLDVAKGQVPAHVGSVAMSGGVVGPQVGEQSAIELLSLDPGGIVIQWFSQTSGIAVGIVLEEAATVWGTLGPTPATILQFNNDNPTVSLLTLGTTLAVAPPTNPFVIQDGIRFADYAPLYVPRGFRLKIITSIANTLMLASIVWCGITASEGVED